VTADPWTTPERQALRASAAAFVRREVLPGLAGWEEAGEVPRALHRAAAVAGLLGIGFPEEVGGQGGDPTLIDRFVRPTLAGELIGALAVTEPDGGSDVAALRARAVRDGDAYVVDGARPSSPAGPAPTSSPPPCAPVARAPAASACWSWRRARPGSR
jgi:acyl-CoA dehydrogenase